MTQRESEVRLPARRSWTVAILLVLGIGLAGLNLRIAVTSVGPILEELTNGLGLSALGAGLLTTLPVVCFALFGGFTPVLARLIGEQRLLLVALCAIALGSGARGFAEPTWLFMVCSAVALSGGAVGNVLLPGLIKRLFPDRVGALTTLYTTAMAVGSALAAALTVPAMHAVSGDWRIVLTGYAAFAVIAAVPWVIVLLGGTSSAAGSSTLSVRRVLGSAMGWQSITYFGTQSALAYILFGWYSQLLRTSGLGAAEAGVQLSYLSALAIPTSLLLPGLAVRIRDQRWIVVACSSCYVVGLVGLGIAPVAAPWVWSTLLGVAMSSFPLALTLFAIRTRTAAGTATLSATSQSVGYLIGGAGPLLFGLAYGATGGWGLSVVIALCAVVANATAGLLIARPRYLEDSLDAQRPRR
ncbi:MFS transporter [Spiractinospora alimapuensis]|uniref:CynX/NimT family MFS transporter n=1 Tax=Spiractinospora alimapuensis TaxID=2820884 RepID=UPI001F1C77BB|nr:MFS transporter [Spiractinospora alimapuensis]QVQ54661.1 MFS transporter [Spiractinospora alimapuensis]